ADAVVDGFVVWTTSDDDPTLDAVAASGLPAVVHAGPHRRGLPVVGIDDRAAAAAIGRLAFAGAGRPVVLGFPVDRHRDRALLTGAPGPSVTYPVTRHRWNGYLDAWRETGGDPAGLRVAVGLTTVRQSLRDQGRRCARIALGLPPAAGPRDPPDWQVIQRTSTTGGNAANPARSAESLPDRGRVLCRWPWPG